MPAALRLVRRRGPAPAEGSPSNPSLGDLGLVCAALVFGLVPIGGLLAGARFGPGEAGAGTALVLLSSREVVRTLGALRRRRA